MNPRSSSLFHFTKTKEILFDILKNGFWPRYCLEDIEWHGSKNQSFVAFPVVCFCDIPLGRISEHVKFYGNFGIGLTKEWGKKNGLNPIMYISKNAHLAGSMKSLINSIKSHADEEIMVKGKEDLRYIFAHSKPIEGKMFVEGEQKEKEFYQETEWRYVAKSDKIRAYLKRVDYDDQGNLKSANELTRKHSSLKFEPNDVKHIFVPRDTDIPYLIDFINSDLGHNSGSDLKVLTSRVTSLESIQQDL